MSNVKSITRKMLETVKLMQTLQDDELEKVLMNRSYLDRLYLMRRNKKTDVTLFEKFSFKDFLQLDEHRI